ncbi:hypothetical protein P692DRAFT_20874744 [Suillus brevipes Sb2]|nr:hypothetical protein P692DRAFT_20874744 [Suillus brevipes Sb2]
MESGGISPSPEIYTPSDACESHCGDDCGQLAAENAQPSRSTSCKGFVFSASAMVVGSSIVLFTFSEPATSTIAPESSLPDTETTKETTNSDSWTDDEVQDPSQLQLREFALAGMRRDFDIWRWIDEIEDFEDPVLPIFEPVSSVLPETMLTEAAEDPDVWQLINEIENFMDPGLPPCESLADAAEDPGFCNYPIRTVLIRYWLSSSRWDALDQ